jgi:hypothetical protein
MDTITNLLTAEMFPNGPVMYWSVYFLCMFLVLAFAAFLAVDEGKLTLSHAFLALFMAVIPVINVVLVGLAALFAISIFIDNMSNLAGNVVLWERKDESK